MVDRHWFAPASLHELAVLRILVFGTQVLFFLHRQPLAGQLALLEAPASWYRPIIALKVLLLPFGPWGEVRPSPTLLTATWLLAVAAGVLAAVGLYARLTMPMAAIAHALLITHWYSYGEWHHPETLMIIALAVLALSPSAAVWSLDAWRRGEGGQRAPDDSGQRSIFARWPLRLLQWLLAFSYLSAAGAKLHYGGLQWMNGYTLAYHYLSEGMTWNRPFALFMASLPPWLHIVPSVFTIVFELTFSLAIIMPRLTWLYVAAGTVFHILIWLLQGPPFFQTVLLYAAFAESLRCYSPFGLGSPERHCAG
jgi:hypothetical protein